MPGETRLFLCGDVMAGRGIDQILPHPVDPVLHEPWVKDARDYVRLAEQGGPKLPRRVPFAYPWHAALPELAARAPAARIINLETAVTAAGEPWPGKGIHYRLHPRNAPVLSALGVDIAVLANNHVLDWGEAGLRDTLETLAALGIATAGAGRDRAQASRPAQRALPGGGRLLVFAWGFSSAGVLPAWAAGPGRAGVNYLEQADAAALEQAVAAIEAWRRPGDRVIVSLHWGDNWGYGVPGRQRRFARALIERAGVALVHGHSSHHPRPIEVYRGRLILYGCGDFLNDYEGIAGHEDYRPELVAMYFPELDRRDGALRHLELVPLRVAGLRLNAVTHDEAHWLAMRLNEYCAPLGTRLLHVPRGGGAAGQRLVLQW